MESIPSPISILVFFALKTHNILCTEVSCGYYILCAVKSKKQIFNFGEGIDGMKPECKLVGENGNVFHLISIVRETLKRNDLLDELQKFENALEELKQSGGNYNDVLNLFGEYVDII